MLGLGADLVEISRVGALLRRHGFALPGPGVQRGRSWRRVAAGPATTRRRRWPRTGRPRRLSSRRSARRPPACRCRRSRWARPRGERRRCGCAAPRRRPWRRWGAGRSTSRSRGRGRLGGGARGDLPEPAGTEGACPAPLRRISSGSWRSGAAASFREGRAVAAPGLPATGCLHRPPLRRESPHALSAGRGAVARPDAGDRRRRWAVAKRRSCCRAASGGRTGRRCASSRPRVEIPFAGHSVLGRRLRARPSRTARAQRRAHACASGSSKRAISRW